MIAAGLRNPNRITPIGPKSACCSTAPAKAGVLVASAPPGK